MSRNKRKSSINTSRNGSAEPFDLQDFIAFDLEEEPPYDVSQSAQRTPHFETFNNRSSRNVSPSPDSSKVTGKKRKLEERDDNGRSKKEKQQARSRFTPWSSDVRWEKCKNGAEMLHREMIAFDSWLAPTQCEHTTRCMVVDLISKAIVSRYPNAKVYPFGSQETQLYLPQGDLDLVVVSPSMENQRRESALRNMAACLRRNNLATDVQVIARAKVPIIKFTSTYAKLRVDISINQINGLSAAKYVNSWLQKWRCIRPMVMVVKHLLVQRGMSEVFSGGLGSYSVIIMVISFLQLHPKIQRGEIDPNRNLGVLLLEFLELYGKNFGYDNCGISIRGRGGYFSKARRGWKDERRPFMLSIEDPHDPSNDISKGSFGILQVRSTFAGAFDILTAAICQKASEEFDSRRKPSKYTVYQDSADDDDELARRALLRDSQYGSSQRDVDSNSLLGTILGASNAMVKQRKDMEDLFYTGILQNRLGRPIPPPSPPPARPKQLAQSAPNRSAKNTPASISNAPRPSREKKSNISEPLLGSQTYPISLSSSPPPPTSKSNGQVQKLGAHRKSPEIITDPSQSTHTTKNGTKSSEQVMGIFDGMVDEIDEFIRMMERDTEEGDEEEEDDDDEQDSRYTSTATSQKRRKITHDQVPFRRSSSAINLEKLMASAPSNYISESDDEEDQLSSSLSIHIDDTCKSSTTDRVSTPNKKLSSQKKNDFWTSKGVCREEQPEQQQEGEIIVSSLVESIPSLIE